MFNYNISAILRQTLRTGVQKTKDFSRKAWVRLAFLGVLILVLSQKELRLPAFLKSGDGSWLGANMLGALGTAPQSREEETLTKKTKTGKAAEAKFWWEDIRDKKIDIRESMNLANEATAVSDALTDEQKAEAAKFSNLGFLLNPGLAERKGVDPEVVAAKNQVVFDYIKRYSATATEEAELFNIPVSITLAQGLLESNCGASNLAKRDNNHFGIKCQDKCIGCRCANYTDDSRYDMFRIFDSAWESFRAHSKLLTGKRYKHLLDLPRTDYKNWAYGLKAAGYATDKSYAEKLIAIVEALKLDAFDK